jgi:ion channel-forming bestrophin family protein
VDMSRYIRHLAATMRSRTVRRLLVPSVISFAQVAVLSIYSQLHFRFGLPPLPALSGDFFSLTGPVLSLLLVFRTDASYNRWDEARQEIGELIYGSRNLLRMGHLAFEGVEGGVDAMRSLTVWTVAYGVTLKAHLRRSMSDTDEPALRELSKWLREDELDILRGVRSKPHACLQVLTHIVRLAPREHQDALDANLGRFEEVLGRCERISRVPIPLSYSRHTSRFLTAWAFLLPLELYTTGADSSLIFAPLITFLLFGVDQIGVQLEQPFFVLPLDLLVDKLKVDGEEAAVLHARLMARNREAVAARAAAATNGG